MKNTKWLFAIMFAMFCSSFALAQAAKPTESVDPGKLMDQGIAGLEREFVSAAEAMPEDKYDFAPTAGEFKGVRTFAQQVKHVAHANYVMSAGILREKPPVEIGNENGPDALKTKAEIVKFLKDSFAYTHKAALTINKKNLLQPLSNPWGEQYPKVSRLELASGIAAHSFDHYGQMVEYLRMNNIIPPASRPKQ